LTFHSGPASYELTNPADGQVLTCDNDSGLPVNIINAPNDNAISQCTSYTDSEKAFISSIIPQTAHHQCELLQHAGTDL
ncbi:hypothetical protein K456DRAFT_1834815, partial [Colletotrichum gloeosporioides 23]